MSILQITPNVYQIPLGAVNCFFIDDEKMGGTLVDCGYENSEQRIFKAIAKIGKRPADIHRLVLTHSHPDHAGSAAALQHQLQIPVIMHREDAALAKQGIAGRLPHIVTPGIINFLVFHLLIKPKPNAIAPFAANELVRHGDELPIGGGMKIIEAPGHSLGQIVLLLKAENLLIAADVCANMGGLALSTVYENKQTGRETLHHIAGNYEFEKACFGHGKPIFKNARQKMAKAFSLN